MFVPDRPRDQPDHARPTGKARGVEPDVKVPADDALRVAQLRALPPLVEQASDPALKQVLRARLAELETKPVR